MSEFIFPDLKKALKSVVIEQNVPTKDIILNSLEVESKNTIKSQITVFLEDTLSYMQSNNLIPDLPEVINVKYINISSKEILFNKVKKFFGQLPAQYNYPASTDISDGTIYISNYFQEEFEKDNSIKKFREQFNNNIQQTLEYAFFHEIGHLFLIEKNKHKVSSKDNALFSQLRINIEEGFAESFAIHMICLKYPQLEFQTNNFNQFQEKTKKLSDDISKLFFYKKHDRLKKSTSQHIKDFITTPIIKTDEMFNVYEFPLIYKKSPFKDQNGQYITDMKIIFDQCFTTSLENNKEVILNKFTNAYIKEFKENLIQDFELMLNKSTPNFSQLIDTFHIQVKNEGFLKKIKGMRSYYTNNISIEQRNKI